MGNGRGHGQDLGKHYLLLYCLKTIITYEIITTHTVIGLFIENTIQLILYVITF